MRYRDLQTFYSLCSEGVFIESFSDLNKFRKMKKYIQKLEKSRWTDSIQNKYITNNYKNKQAMKDYSNLT